MDDVDGTKADEKLIDNIGFVNNDQDEIKMQPPIPDAIIYAQQDDNEDKDRD